jgi:molecular chaperone DnaK
MTSSRARGWVLSIDFGTTSTAGAMTVGDGEELVEIDNAPRMPSIVCWKEPSNGSPGRLLLGEEADNEAVRAPQCVERCPKRKLAGADYLLLGSEQIRVTDAIAAIFGHVVAEASPQQGGTPPRELRLTHPARWGERRLGKLRDAATAAGFNEPLLIPEPVGAAVYFAKERLEPGEHVVVYDLGGGTFDTAVLCRTVDGFDVVGKPGGLDDLGGEDFDYRLYRFLGRRLDQEQWQTLTSEDSDPVWQRAVYDFRKDVRRAKERLSKYQDATVLTPIPGEPDLSLSRSDFETLVRDDIQSTVDELARTVSNAGQTVEALSAIYLAGGSSRIPLVSELINERFGRQPSVFGDPKAVIALGATQARVRPATPPGSHGPEPPVSTPIPASGAVEPSPAATPEPAADLEPAGAAATATAPIVDAPPTRTPVPLTMTAAAEAATSGDVQPVPSKAQHAPSRSVAGDAFAALAAKTGPAGLLFATLAVLGALLVIGSLFLHGVVAAVPETSAWKASPKRLPIVLTILSVGVIGLVVAGVASQLRSRDASFSYERALGLAAVISAFMLGEKLVLQLATQRYSDLKLGWWLSIAGSLIATVACCGAVIAREQAR